MIRIDGDPPLPLGDALAARFLANYVPDLMGPDDVRRWLGEVRRFLTPAT